jgi:hypothetical protein
MNQKTGKVKMSEDIGEQAKEISADEKVSLRKEALRRIMTEDEDLPADFMIRAQGSHPGE